MSTTQTDPPGALGAARRTGRELPERWNRAPFTRFQWSVHAAADAAQLAYSAAEDRA